MKNIEELMEATINRINTGCKTVVVSVPAKKRKGQYCYPFGKGTPKAEILSTNKGRDVVAFDAIDLLAFLVVANSQKDENEQI